MSSVLKTEKWVIFLCTLIAFSPVFRAGFVFYDDPDYVLNNPYIKHFTFDNIRSIFQGKATLLYVPLTICSYYLDNLVFGGSPLAFHLINLALHILNIYLLLKLLISINIQKEIVFILLVFFAVNPFNTQSVCWITERKDVLCVFFLLLSAIYFIRHQNELKRKDYWLSLIFLVLSCFSKPMSVTLPVLFLLFLYYKGNVRIKDVLKLSPHFLISLIFGVISIVSIRNGSDGKIAIHDYNFIQKIYLFIAEIGYYFFRAFIPGRQTLFNFFPKISELFTTPTLTYFIAGTFIFVLISLLRKKKLLVYIFIAWIVLLAPVLQIFPNTHSYVSERYLYLTMLLPVGMLFCVIKDHIHFNYRLVGYGCMLIFTPLTYLQSKKWRNTETLFKSELKVNPMNSMAFNNLGHYYNINGNFKEGLKHTGKAFELDERNALYINNYAWSLAGTGRTDSAIILFKKAITLKYNLFEAHNNLGVCYMSINKPAEAFKEFKIAESLKKDYPEVLYNLGAYYLKNDSINKAVPYLSKASFLGHANAAKLLNKYGL